MNLIAEGVETKAQLQFFNEVEQCEIQGFYISKPIPEKEFISWLIEHNKELSNSAI